MKTIKQILVLALVLFFAQTASAQFNLGLMGGANFADFKLNVDEPIPVPLGQNTQGSFSSRTAFAIGGVAEYYFSPMVGLSVQPMYSQQGSKFTIEGPVPSPLSEESRVKLNYIDIPVMLKVRFGEAGVKPYITSGFMVGFLTSAKSESSDESTDIKDSFKSTNFAWNIGAGLNLAAGANTVFIEGRYALGLTDINEGPQVEPYSEVQEVKTKGIQVMAGVTFPLGAQ